ncbi:MAG: hypothetical protein ABIS36_14440 [Chryseolinea sp.]
MRNSFLPILIILFAVSAFAQTDINNEVTDKHKQIKGTRFLLIPPNVFVEAVNFQGFQQLDNNASILVIEIPEPFSETLKAFSNQTLKTQGVMLKTKENIKVNGNDGILLSTEQVVHGSNFSKYILAFGNNRSTFMVNGMFPKDVYSLREEILASIRSVVYDTSLLVDPLSNMTFSVKTDDTKLKFAKNISGTLLYTVDGKVPTESVDKTSFLVGMSMANVQTLDKRLATINRIKRLPYTDLALDENQVNEIQIDGVDGYEITAEGSNKKGVRELIYQIMLYNNNVYYLIIGTAQEEFESNLLLFKNVAKTLRHK